MLRRFMLGLLVCCFPGLAVSRTWHVSSNAASGGDGTQ
eukprot:COSAG02_NODE_51623_length_313_cov_0.640187_1_plen_37_part_01